MKIVHVIDSLATGGAEQLVVDLTTYGRSQGHDIKIFLLHDKDGIPRKRATSLNLPVTVLGNSLRDPLHLFRLRKLTADADIVHVHLFPAQYWARFIKVPTIFTEHNTSNRRMGRRRFYIPERIAYQKFLKIVAISEGVAEAIRTHLKFLHLSNGVYVAPNGIGEEFFNISRDYSKTPSRLVSVGSLSRRKQHHLAIKAIAQLPDVTLRIAGEGPMRKELEQLIFDLGVSSQVELLGNVDDIPRLLEESDLFLSTSEVEGFGIAAGEAQASGLPVVGPNIPGLREVISHGTSGLLFDQFEPKEIAETIQTVLADQNYMVYAQKSRENAERFTIAKSFQAQMDIYLSILHNTPCVK